jgi:hypothetical protein
LLLLLSKRNSTLNIIIAKMSARSNNQPAILIPADFSDVSWHATSFAMKFLFRVISPVTILQNHKNPGWGHLLMRKLSHYLKKITKNELRALRKKILKHFKIDKKKIDITVGTIQQKSKCRGINRYLRSKNRDLIVIQTD